MHVLIQHLSDSMNEAKNSIYLNLNIFIVNICKNTAKVIFGFNDSWI